MADATAVQAEASTQEEVVESSVEEVDQLADDIDTVEETIVYEPSDPSSDNPSTTESTSVTVPVPDVSESEPPQVDSQTIPDSQPEETEPGVPEPTAKPLFPSVAESPRKRKSEDGE